MTPVRPQRVLIYDCHTQTVRMERMPTQLCLKEVGGLPIASFARTSQASSFTEPDGVPTDHHSSINDLAQAEIDPKREQRLLKERARREKRKHRIAVLARSLMSLTALGIGLANFVSNLN